MEQAPSTTAAAVLDDERLIDVLVNSLYPGAKRESAALVLAYCRAAGLDPMQKPVHIVPMRVKTGMKDRWGNDEYAFRDTIMPGIGLYRVQAARTGQYAGQDEPRFGEVKVLTFDRAKVTWETGADGKRKKHETWQAVELEYPEWAAVTVYRLVGGFKVPFTAVERWTENYATAGRDSDAPNEMWSRRVYGQLVKCAEAQALRKAFPEVGSQPTAEEVEGRLEPGDYIDAEPPAPPSEPRRASETRAATQEAPPAVATLPSPSDPVTFDTPAPRTEELVPAHFPQVATPEGDRGPAPAAATPPPPPPPPPAAPAANDPPASEGERTNVIITAKARKADIAAVLAKLGIGLSVEDKLAGMTKGQFKAIKAALA